MNRRNIEKIMAAKLDVPEITVRPFVQAFLETISDCLMYRQHITIQNFGTFKPWKQVSRPVRNPQTGESLMLRPRISIKFTPSKLLFNKMNSCTDLISKKD